MAMSGQGRRRFAALVVVAAGFALAVPSALADDEGGGIRNGGFEIGTLAGWHASSVQIGDIAFWSVYTGRQSPVSGLRIPAPPQGRFAAVVDQDGPGSNVLYQDFRVDDEDSHLQMTVWYRNRNRQFFTPHTLLVNRVANQQLRIDIMRPSAPLRSLRARDILATVFRTRVGDPASAGPMRLDVDLSRFDDRKVRLRIAEADNQFFFQVGVDAVRLAEDEDDDAVTLVPRRAPSVHATPRTPVLRRYVR
jgi:hypothetical protein